MLTGEIHGEIPIQRFFETLAQIAGEKYGIAVIVESAHLKAEKEPAAESRP